MRSPYLVTSSILLLIISQRVYSYYDGCVGRKNGFYALGCSNTFFHCMAERAEVSTCIAGTYADVSRGGVNCVNWDQVPACLAGEADLGVGIEMGEIHPVEEYDDDEEGSGEGSLSTRINCTSIDDGFYALGCSNKHYECANGSSRMLYCESSFFYDDEGSIKNGICNQRDQVSACTSGAIDEAISKSADSYPGGSFAGPSGGGCEDGELMDYCAPASELKKLNEESERKKQIAQSVAKKEETNTPQL